MDYGGYGGEILIVKRLGRAQWQRSDARDEFPQLGRRNQPSKVRVPSIQVNRNRRVEPIDQTVVWTLLGKTTCKPWTGRAVAALRALLV
jgi:hypothetical protein